MPRFKRLHNLCQCHGMHVLGAGGPGSAAFCTWVTLRDRGGERHGLLGDWRTGGSAAICTKSRGFSAHRTSGTLPGHRATGSSLLLGLGGSSRRTISVRFRALWLRSGYSWDFMGPLLRGHSLPRSTRVAATGCSWASCFESSGVVWVRSAGILAALGLGNNIGSAARSGLLDSRLSVDLLRVVVFEVPLPVPRLS